GGQIQFLLAERRKIRIDKFGRYFFKACRAPYRPPVFVAQCRPDALGEIVVSEAAHSQPVILDQRLANIERSRRPDMPVSDCKRQGRTFAEICNSRFSP